MSVSAILSSCVNANAHSICGDAEGACAALEAMRAAGHSPRVGSYTACLKAVGGAAQMGRARRLLAALEEEFEREAKQARERGGEPHEDFTPNVRTLNTFLRACIVGGGVDDAAALLRRITGDACSAKMLSKLLRLVDVGHAGLVSLEAFLRFVSPLDEAPDALGVIEIERRVVGILERRGVCYASSAASNAVHGSGAPASAQQPSLDAARGSRSAKTPPLLEA